MTGAPVLPLHAAPWPLARVGTESRAFGPHSLMNTALEGWSCGLAPRKAACRVLEPEKTVPHVGRLVSGIAVPVLTKPEPAHS